MNVAQTILSQLGGNKFSVMTGAKNFVSDGPALQFKLPTNFAAKKINFVRITLDPSDTYTMKFFNFRGLNLKEVESVSGVYNDQLKSIFTGVTGLDCSL
jgi:hypothetical protein